MRSRFILLTVLLLTPLPALGIGYVYTGVGDDGRQNLELTSATVDVQIDERIARTRTDQIFTNHSDREARGDLRVHPARRRHHHGPGALDRRQADPGAHPRKGRGSTDLRRHRAPAGSTRP